MGITENTAGRYLTLAKRKLGVREISTAVAVGYALKAIARPELTNPDTVSLLREERELIPLIGRGLSHSEMANELQRPINVVRRDGRGLLARLGAKNHRHVMKRAWQLQLLTEHEVLVWLR